MKQIAALTVKNAQRHFVVWGLLATILMYAGMSENESNAANGHFDRAPAAGTLEDVTSKHKCKDTVEGVFPTAIIAYNVHTGGYFHSEKPSQIAAALDEEFAGKDWHGFSVRYFCK